MNMKNLMIALSLFFALGASAQSKMKRPAAVTPTTTVDPQVAVEKAALKNVNDLVAFTPVNSQIQTALKELFVEKQNLLMQVAGLSQERKDVAMQGIEFKLSILLEPDTFAKVKSNKTLYQSLIN